ncbi:MAG: sensor histidine kinase [Myxococcales bacterium]|nr:sensor histidine kinase [Myxococcales bacterium]
MTLFSFFSRVLRYIDDPRDVPLSAGFDAVAEAQSRVLARRTCAGGAALTVLLSPYDFVLLAQGDPRGAMLLQMRAAFLAIFALYFLASKLLEGRINAVLIAAVPALLSTAVAGAAIGRIAQSHDYWFTTLYIIPVMSAAVTIRFVHRLILAIFCIVTPLLGFSLTFRGTMTESELVHTVGLFIMAAAFGVYNGGALYGEARRAFELRLALAEANSSLEARVEKQTRELRKLAMRLEEVIESERRRLARELHDDLGQELTAMRFETEAMRMMAQEPKLQKGFVRILSALERSHLSVRAILESLRPRILDEEGLRPSIDWLARQFRERTQVSCTVAMNSLEGPDAEISLVAFRIVQESLTNIARHAEAQHVHVSVESTGRHLQVTVEDDGKGALGPNQKPGRGMVGMKERAMAVGGSFQVSPGTPSGTTIRVVLPLDHTPLSAMNSRPPP